MNFKYKIIERHPELHSIVVRYYSAAVSEEYLANKDSEGNPILKEDGTFQRCKYDLNIQLWKVPPPTGTELHDRIVELAPTAGLDLLAKVLDPATDTSLSTVESLVGQETEAESTIPVTKLGAKE